MKNRKYKRFPPFVQKRLQGTTRFSFAEIREFAHGIIEKRKRYILGVSDCHNFAIDLVHKIFNSYKLVPAAMKLGTSALRQLVRPVCLAITEALEWTGVIREPLQNAFRWLYPQVCVGDRDVNSHGQSYHDQHRHHQNRHQQNYCDQYSRDRNFHSRDYVAQGYDNQKYCDQYHYNWDCYDRDCYDQDRYDRDYRGQSYRCQSYRG
uniref:Uncharacterized protein n=1 Tax=Coccidioides posadasii RMSCC 3488 TaxID=454284 RepID=A0A0J6F0Y9_COCPO|nr:hypothetical protein CPAG_02879 [Coccidioides posadasii RMSCC 3488]